MVIITLTVQFSPSESLRFVLPHGAALGEWLLTCPDDLRVQGTRTALTAHTDTTCTSNKGADPAEIVNLSKMLGGRPNVDRCSPDHFIPLVVQSFPLPLQCTVPLHAPCTTIHSLHVCTCRGCPHDCLVLLHWKDPTSGPQPVDGVAHAHNSNDHHCILLKLPK